MAPRQVPPGGPEWMGRWALGSACRVLSGDPSWAGEPCAVAQAWAGARWYHYLQAWGCHCSHGPLPAATFATLSLVRTCTWIIPWTWGSQEPGCPSAQAGGHRVDGGGRRPRKAGHSAQAQAGSLEPQHHGLTCTGSNPPTGLTCACITPPPQGSLRRPQKSRGHQGRVSISQGPGPLPGDRWPQEQVPLPGTPLPRLSQEPQEASRGLCHQEAEEGTQATGSPCRHRSAHIPGVGVAQDLAGPPRITAAGPLLLARPGGIPLALGHLRLLHPCWRSRAGGCSPRPCPHPSASGGLAPGEDQAVLPAQGGCQRPGSPLPSAVRTPAAWARPHAEEGSYQKGTQPKT
ncbi:uncharacterized protein LOC144293451 [Canis aureus]